MKELVAFKCKNCGKIMYPEHARCLNCKGREFEPAEPLGDPKLITFTDNCTLPWGIDERCRFLGIVEFENKVKATGWLKVKQPKIGMKLHATWAPVRVISGEEVCGLVLVPSRGL
jgi:uncharacterized OB-fold protein